MVVDEQLESVWGMIKLSNFWSIHTPAILPTSIQEDLTSAVLHLYNGWQIGLFQVFAESWPGVTNCASIPSGGGC